MRIVFTGGGTGGHFYPILAIARELKRIADEERIIDLHLFYLGPEESLPPEFEKEGIYSSRIAAGKLRTYFSIENFFDALKAGIGILQALWRLFFIMPDVVVSKGGYGSFPALVASRIYRLPVLIHESDAVPGRVNRWSGRFARRIAVSFAAAAKFFPPERTALTGNPIRKRLLSATQESAREILGVFSDRPVLFITGGSQGAQVINRTVIEILKDLLREFEIIHQAGAPNLEDIRLETVPLIENGGGKEYYHLYGSLTEEQMAGALALATIAVSRAGSTIFEFAARGVPAVLIPLAIAAGDHQRKNAYEYAGRGAAVVIEEDNLTPSVLLHELQNLRLDPGRLKKMSEHARAFAVTNAAEVIAREALSLGLH